MALQNSALSYYRSNKKYIDKNPTYFSAFKTYDDFIRYLPSAPGSDASAGHLFAPDKKRTLLISQVGDCGVLFDLLLRCSVNFLLLEHFEQSTNILITKTFGEEYKLFLKGFEALVNSKNYINLSTFKQNLSDWNSIKPGPKSKAYFTELESYIRYARNDKFKIMVIILTMEPSAIVLSSMRTFYKTESRSAFPFTADQFIHLFGIAKM